MNFTDVVVATVIVKVNTIDDYTTTITQLATKTEVSDGLETVENNADFWNSKMSTTGITMSSGTPVLSFHPRIYTDVDAYFTITKVL